MQSIVCGALRLALVLLDVTTFQIVLGLQANNRRLQFSDDTSRLVLLVDGFLNRYTH